MSAASGKGVTESLALAHAPLTRMTPAGTLFPGSTLFEKSPPFPGSACALSPCAHAGGNAQSAGAISHQAPSKHRRNRESIFLPLSELPFQMEHGFGYRSASSSAINSGF